MPNWILSLQDTFAHADTTPGAALSNTGVPTSPSPGAANGWYDRAGNIYSIASNKLKGASSSGGWAAQAFLYRVASEASLNSRIVYQCSGTASGDTWYALNRFVESTGDSYCAFINFGSSSTVIQIFGFVGGGPTGSVSGVTANAAAGYTYDHTHTYQVDFATYDLGTTPASCSVTCTVTDVTSNTVYATASMTDSYSVLQNPGVLALGTAQGGVAGVISEVQGYVTGFTPGQGTFSSSTTTTVNATFTPPSGGASPVTVNTYGSLTDPTFTPGSGNIISGQTGTSVSWTPTGSTPGQVLYLKQLATDNTGATVVTPVVCCCLQSSVINLGGVGDSITQIYSTGYAAAWAALIPGSSLNWIDCGSTGSTTLDWVAAINTPSTVVLAGLNQTWNQIIASLVSNNCKTIQIMLGANDAKYTNATTALTYQSNLVTICNALLSAVSNARVVVHSPLEVQSHGANSSTGWDDTAPKLIASYQAACDAVVNGTTILKGDRLNYKNSILFPAFTGTDGTHPGGQQVNPTYGFNEFGYTSMEWNWVIAMAGALGLTGVPAFTGVFPAISTVLANTNFGLTGSNMTGNVVLPPANTVATGTSYGPASSITGSYSGTSGGPYPQNSDVRSSVNFGSTGVGTLHVPTASQVLASVPVDNSTGNVVLPTAGQVESGVLFGPASSLSGSYSGSSGNSLTLAELDAALATQQTSLLTALATAPVGSVTNAVALNLSQPISLAPVTGTIGDALAAARADGFGKILFDPIGLTLKVFAHDGITLIKQFAVNLDQNGNVIERS